MICRRGQPGRNGNGMNSLHPARARVLACMQGPESAPQIPEVLKRSCIVHQVKMGWNRSVRPQPEQMKPYREDEVEPVCPAPTHNKGNPYREDGVEPVCTAPALSNETLSDPVFAFDFI